MTIISPHYPSTLRSISNDLSNSSLWLLRCDMTLVLLQFLVSLLFHPCHLLVVSQALIWEYQETHCWDFTSSLLSFLYTRSSSIPEAQKVSLYRRLSNCIYNASLLLLTGNCPSSSLCITAILKNNE